MPQRQAFIGVGTMGSLMAGCLLDAGIDLNVHDLRRSAAEPLLERGASWADTPRQAVDGCGMVWASLPGPEQVVSALLGDETGALAGMANGAVLVDTTTDDPDVARRVAAACRQNGVAMLDAPVSGRPPNMTMMVGGDRSVFDQVSADLETVAARVFYVGESGVGCAAKLATQYMGYTNLIAAIQGMLIGKAAGIDPAVLAEIVPVSAGASRAFNAIPNAILDGSYQAGGTLDIVAKDVALAVRPGRTIEGASDHRLSGGCAVPGRSGTWLGQRWLPGSGPYPGGTGGAEFERKLNQEFCGFSASALCYHAGISRLGNHQRRNTMAITFQPSTFSGMVDRENGLVSREIFVNSDIYAEEQERIFTRAWLFVGHESQVSKPGDFFISSMGEESVILCRDRQGEVHVFLNSCTHRGMKVCRYDEGNTPIFSCPYHGWSFATDGALVGVPYYKDAYHEELDKSQWGLLRVPRMTNYKGGIWASWDPQAPDFLEYIGEFRTYLDILFDGWDGSEGGTEIIGGIEKWLVPSNWKFPAENFIGDRYHNISHRSVDLVGIGPSGQGRRDNSEREGAKSLDVSFPERGHGTVIFLRPEEAQPVRSYQNDPIVAEYFHACEIARKERQGQLWRIMGGPGTIFPNMSYLPRQPRSIAVWHPRGPDQTEVWRWYLVDSTAPPEVKEFLRQYYIRYSGPSGLTEQDDMENWNYAHAASRGAMARRRSYNYQMGMGYAVDDFEDGGLRLPGTVLDTTKARAGEQNQRTFYTRWADFMAARDWDELAGWRHGNGANGSGSR